MADSDRKKADSSAGDAPATKAEQVEKETGQSPWDTGEAIEVPESGLDPTMPAEGYTGEGAPVHTFPHLNPGVTPYPAERPELPPPPATDAGAKAAATDADAGTTPAPAPAPRPAPRKK